MRKRFSEVVQSALNLTQINESEVLDWSRKVGMGSSAMRSVWDTILRHDDNFQLQSFTFAGSEPVELPEDLYTIRHVVDRNGEPLRRQDGFTRLGSHEYRVVNTSIQTGGSGPTTVIYTHRPPDLTMNIPPAYLSRDVLKINHQYLAQNIGSMIILIDLARDEEVFRYEIGELPVLKWDVTVDGNIVLLNENELLIYDGRVEEYIYQRLNVSDFFLDNSAYAVYRTIDDSIHELDYSLGSKHVMRPFYPVWGDVYVRLNNNIIQYARPLDATWIDYEYNADSLVVDKNGKYIYFTIDNNPYCRSQTRRWIPEINGVQEISSAAERGDGFNCIVYQARKYSINNIYPDTILDYPNTAYFDLLEAKMAEEILMQVRQNATDMRAMRLEREATLASMLARNKSDPYRVKNLYRVGSRHGMRG